MAGVALPTFVVQTIKEYYWNDTSEEMTALVTASVSGWRGDVSWGCAFAAENSKAIVGGLALIPAAYGLPHNLFQKSIDKITCVAIRLTRTQVGLGGRLTTTFTTQSIVSIVQPGHHKKWRVSEEESLLNAVLPNVNDLPGAKRIPLYSIACKQNGQGAEIEKTTTIAVSKLDGWIEAPPLKKRKVDVEDEPGEGSPPSLRDFGHYEPMSPGGAFGLSPNRQRSPSF